MVAPLFHLLFFLFFCFFGVEGYKARPSSASISTSRPISFCHITKNTGLMDCSLIHYLSSNHPSIIYHPSSFIHLLLTLTIIHPSSNIHLTIHSFKIYSSILIIIIIIIIPSTDFFPLSHHHRHHHHHHVACSQVET